MEIKSKQTFFFFKSDLKFEFRNMCIWYKTRNELLRHRCFHFSTKFFDGRKDEQGQNKCPFLTVLWGGGGGIKKNPCFFRK